MGHSKPLFISVSRRFSFAFIGVVTLVLFFFAGIAIYNDNSKINSDLEKRLENALQLSYISLPTPLWNLDNSIVDDFVEALFLDEAMVYAEVVWGEEIISKKVSPRLKVQAIADLNDPSQFIDRLSEILYEGNKVGTIRLVMSRESVKSQLAVSILGIITLSIFIIIAIAATSFIITQKYITRPLLKLQSAASSIAQGNLDTVIEKSGRDEIGLLAEHLDDMRGAIKELFAEVHSSKKKIEDYSRTLEQKVEVRTKKLAQSVDELKALGDVSQVVSSSLDLEAVLTSIVRRSVLLSESDGGTIFEFNEAEQVFVPKINYGISESLAQALQVTPPYKGDKTAIGQSALRLAPVQIPDLVDVPDYPFDFVLKEGFRSLMALPLIRENRLIGGLVVQRKEAGEYPTRVVQLLQTFAAQSVLAIHNAKLFHEIEDKSLQLQVADKHKSEFLANMSHELRTPLNAILGYTELILDKIYGDVPEKIEDVLQRLEKNGRHLLNLINDILDISKIEAGQLSLSLNDYSMEEVIKTVYTSVEALAAEKSLSLQLDIQADLPVGKGDEQRIAQILMNLIGNAIKFTEEGQISVAACVQDGSFLVSVSDTGKGLSAANQDVIFKEFQQVDGSSTREKGGTGLGLSIAKKIVEMHGGRIWVESESDEGAIFKFRIPLRVKEQKEPK